MKAARAFEFAGWMSLLLMLLLASPGVRVEAAAGTAPIAAAHGQP